MPAPHTPLRLGSRSAVTAKYIYCGQNISTGLFYAGLGKPSFTREGSHVPGSPVWPVCCVRFHMLLAGGIAEVRLWAGTAAFRGWHEFTARVYFWCYTWQRQCLQHRSGGSCCLLSPISAEPRGTLWSCSLPGSKSGYCSCLGECNSCWRSSEMAWSCPGSSRLTHFWVNQRSWKANGLSWAQLCSLRSSQSDIKGGHRGWVTCSLRLPNDSALAGWGVLTWF